MTGTVVTARALSGGGWPFGALREFSYDFLMVDPPWPTTLRSPKGEGKSFSRHYGAMSFEAIAALPVGQLASRHCVLWLWCTWPLLLHGGDPKRHWEGADAAVSRPGACMKAWGFRYCTGGAWLKRKAKGAVAFGTGYRLRSACEPFLIGIMGEPKTSRRERNFVDGLAREHSRKPDKAYELAERWMPGARYAEIFSQTPRPHWDTWGEQAGKFEPVVALNAAPPTRSAA